MQGNARNFAKSGFDNTVILTPDTQVKYVKGVGPRRADQLARLGIKTVSDLLLHFPARYEDRTNIVPISELRAGETQTVRGVVESAKEVRMRGRRLFEMVIKDASGRMRAVWFSTRGGWLAGKFKPGTEITATGRVSLSSYHRCFEMPHPDIEMARDNNEKPSGGIMPVYPLTEGVAQKSMRAIIGRALDASPKIVETLPERLLNSLKLPGRDEAVRRLHKPLESESPEMLNSFGSPAHRRIIFEEFFIIECAVAILRNRNTDQVKGVSINVDSAELAKVVSKLPFTLTPDQNRTLGEVCKDMKSSQPMNRLLQGDVGCGKTVVAVAAAALAERSGFQSVLMAPTEILAIQHYKTVTKMNKALKIRTALLTSGSKGKEKARIKQLTADGGIDLLVGTHAVIQQDVAFKNLGFVIIDEQHRFGVRQRGELMSKGEKPNTLIMTATPIPRTLAMTLFGDLDASVIRTMPEGRGEVETRIVQPADISRAHLFIHSEIKKGRQAFIIYPLVEESEKVDLKAAIQMWDVYRKKIFADLRVGLLHGRMKQEEKNRIMDGFTSREVDILVSTTVVEVGIDQPNATVMMIEHAERFGLAQLHQLRGRVGRGGEKSYCLLAVEPPLSNIARERLKVMVKTRDGFIIAEKDLELRGGGDFLGARQSGLPLFKMANLARDYNLLKLARDKAFAYIKKDPNLKLPESQPLRDELKKNWREKFNLIDVG